MTTTTEFQLVDINKLVPYANNARTHNKEQILKLRSSLREFGFVNPVIIDKEYNVLAGHGRIEAAKEEWKVDIYLEPGEAWALNAGFFLTTVLDVLQNGDTRLAILDGSAACHMPDVLEMPYRPMVIGSGEPGEKRWNCRLAGKSCLAGDVIGEYSFDEPLKAGDRLVFTDMAIYSMVKTTTFNGLRLPSIVRWNPETDGTRLVREFGYEDFKMRLS